MYALGQFSRFDRPDFYRIGVVSNTGPQLSALFSPIEAAFKKATPLAARESCKPELQMACGGLVSPTVTRMGALDGLLQACVAM